MRNAVLSGQRPPVPQGCCAELQELMQDCWADDANHRPTFNMILGHLALISRVAAFDVERASQA